MRPTAGKLRLSPIIERLSEVLDVTTKIVDKAIVTDVGEGCECKVGDTVVIRKTSLKKFQDEGIDGELIEQEDKIVQLIIEKQ